MGRLITVDGDTIDIAPAEGEVFTLRELQEYVDGYIEVIPQHVYPDRVYLCDEEGLLKGKDINFTATEEITPSGAEPIPNNKSASPLTARIAPTISPF